MRLRGVIVSIVTLGTLLGSLGATGSNAEPAPGKVYLALGDSLAASVQPTGDVHSGYAEQIFQLEQADIPGLRLVKLGCPGERTNTIDHARRLCPYAAGSQLAEAVSRLESQDVAFVTLQIGSNDTFQCFRFRKIAFDQACIDELLPKISARLTSIVETLRAADPDVPIVGANYHDPLLVAATFPGVPIDVAVANAAVWSAINDTLEQTYAALGVPVADNEAAFSATDFDTIVHLRGFGDVPISVARVCEWSFACSEEFDNDFHPNTIGYAAMTGAFEAAIATALAEPAA